MFICSTRDCVALPLLSPLGWPELGESLQAGGSALSALKLPRVRRLLFPPCSMSISTSMPRGLRAAATLSPTFLRKLMPGSSEGPTLAASSAAAAAEGLARASPALGGRGLQLPGGPISQLGHPKWPCFSFRSQRLCAKPSERCPTKPGKVSLACSRCRPFPSQAAHRS